MESNASAKPTSATSHWTAQMDLMRTTVRTTPCVTFRMGHVAGSLGQADRLTGRVIRAQRHHNLQVMHKNDSKEESQYEEDFRIALDPF